MMNAEPKSPLRTIQLPWSIDTPKKGQRSQVGGDSQGQGHKKIFNIGLKWYGLVEWDKVNLQYDYWIFIVKNCNMN